MSVYLEHLVRHIQGDTLEKVADRIVLLSQGRVQADVPIGELDTVREHLAQES